MRELLQMIGQQGFYHSKNWTIRIVVVDVKRVYGIDKLYVENLNCKGETNWIDAASFERIPSDSPLFEN